jgi:hypothetical protein
MQNERNDIDILRRRMDASVMLIKALGEVETSHSFRPQVNCASNFNLYVFINLAHIGDSYWVCDIKVMTAKGLSIIVRHYACNLHSSRISEIRKLFNELPDLGKADEAWFQPFPYFNPWLDSRIQKDTLLNMTVIVGPPSLGKNYRAAPTDPRHGGSCSL